MSEKRQLDLLHGYYSFEPNKIPVSGLIQAFKGVPPKVKSKILTMLCRSVDRNAIEFVKTACEDLELRHSALSKLVYLIQYEKHDGERLLPTFLSHIDDPSRLVRAVALEGIGYVARRRPALDMLVLRSVARRLEDGDLEVIKAALHVLIDGMDAPPLDEMIAASAHTNRQVRLESIAGLSRLREDPQVISALIRRLTDDFGEVRLASARVLAAVAPNNPAAVDALIEFLSVQDGNYALDEVVAALTSVERAKVVLDSFAIRVRERAERQAEVESGGGGGGGNDWERTDPCGLGAESGYRGILGGY